MDRNPRFPAALDLQDMKPGQEFVQYNTNLGVVMNRGVVLGSPCINGGDDRTFADRLVVDTCVIRRASERFPEALRLERLFLGDMGVAPYRSGNWNAANITCRPDDLNMLIEAFNPVAEEPEASDDTSSQGEDAVEDNFVPTIILKITWK